MRYINSRLTYLLKSITQINRHKTKYYFVAPKEICTQTTRLKAIGMFKHFDQNTK